MNGLLRLDLAWGTDYRKAHSEAAETMQILDVQIETVAGVVVVKPIGDLDVATAPVLRRKLLRLLNTRCRVVVDLSAVSFIDCAGLGVLVGAHRRGLQRGLGLSLAAPARPARRLLGLTGLDQFLEIHTTLAEATTAPIVARAPHRAPAAG